MDLNYDSKKLIGKVKEVHKNLERKGWDWRSFYNGWIEGRANMLAELREGNTDNLESGKCNKHIVKPRFVPENLVMKGGAHIMRVDVFEDFRKQPACRIKCIDDLSCTQDLDGEWVEEIGEGCFYLDVEKIDLVISKLQEAKAFLNGA
jgi:hypothetical protein